MLDLLAQIMDFMDFVGNSNVSNQTTMSTDRYFLGGLPIAVPFDIAISNKVHKTHALKENVGTKTLLFATKPIKSMVRP